MKGTSKGCGSSAGGVMEYDQGRRVPASGVARRTKGTGKGYGSSADGVMGRVVEIQGICKGCGSWSGIIGMKGTSKGLWLFYGCSNRLCSEG